MKGYLALASHLPKLMPYELPQVIALIPPPPMNVPMPIRKALSTKGENKTIHYLLRVMNMNLIIPHGLDCSKSMMYPVTPCVYSPYRKKKTQWFTVSREKKKIIKTGDDSYNIFM